MSSARIESDPAATAGITTADAPQRARQRQFLSYRGVGLPLQLVQELDAQSVRNRNTYYRATYDAQDRPVCIEQVVYGETALQHDYRWHADGRLAEAVIRMPDEEPVVKRFD